eukprot:GHUV01024146.1.p1 GENE.GHUV01024146.1~~GHUV01024146.1.p1  ORF type:complete len:469 (+),score=155.16 GHUV01024146.1:124-1407(+)
MCKRLRDMNSKIMYSHLTAAVAGVLQTVPSNLSWVRHVDGSSTELSSYEAVASDGSGREHLYSINVLDGTVLLDGFPPGRLPRDITSHPLYIRTFGSVDFEVFNTDQGVLVTTRPVNGRFYEFYLSVTAAEGQPSELVITEQDRETGQQLQLLGVGADNSCQPWGDQMPIRFKELYSHWLSRQQNVIILRARDFQEHDVYHIISYNPDASASSAVTCRCWRVPPHLQAHHWCELLGRHKATLQAHVLFVEYKESHVLQVLSKFEQKQFIHAYRCTTRRGSSSQTLMAFELPRFGLEFELHDNGQLASKQFKGYCLHECQQLVADGAARYTLPDFDRYLVLHRCAELSCAHVPGSGRADVLVLVPAGPVQPGWATGAKVSVLTDCAVGATLQVSTVRLRPIRHLSYLPGWLYLLCTTATRSTTGSGLV